MKTIKYVPFLVLALFLMTGVRFVHAECWGPYSGSSIWGNDCTGSNDSNDDDSSDDSDTLNVVTSSATNVDEDSATLRGEITDLDESEDYERFFEWGTDEDDLDHTSTISGTTDNEGTFSRTITGLNDDEEYFYRACAESQDSNDEDCGSIRSFTTDEDGGSSSDDDDNDDDSDSDGSVVTTDATGVTSSSAILNGVVINRDGNQRVWFAYGPTTSLGHTTSSQTVSADQALVSVQINGLTSGQAYFFRLVSNNGDEGDVKAFIPKSTGSGSTGGSTTPTHPTTPVVHVTNSGEYVNVDLAASAKEVDPGDEFFFEALYENLTSTTIKNMTVTVNFPEGITPTKTEMGSVNGQNVVVYLPEVPAKASGHFTITAKAVGKFRTDKVLVSVIDATYDHPTDDDSTIDTTDYVIVKVTKGDTSQAAGALFAGSFFPHSFLGWLLIVIVITLIIYAATRVSKKREEDKIHAQPGIKIAK